MNTHSLIYEPTLGGFPRPMKHHRTGPTDFILIHRNTTSELWKAKHPEDKFIDDVVATYRYHRRVLAWTMFPYHFFIDDDAENENHAIIYQLHTLDTKAPHASDLNNRAVGIALNVDGRKEPPSEAILHASIWLTANLLSLYPRAEVRGHSDRKACPGQFVKVDWIRERAQELAPVMVFKDSTVIASREW